MTLRVTPILPRFGAEISGIDITKPLDEATQRDMVATMDQWGVCIYRDTGLTTRAISPSAASSAIWSWRRRHRERRRAPATASCSMPATSTADGNDHRGPSAIRYRKGDRLWHTNSSFMPMRSSYSLLLAHEVPSEGGETWFADTRTAYDDLPQAMKDRIDGLEVEHSHVVVAQAGRRRISEEEIDGGSKARHPLVHVHAGSGRKALYIAAHARDIVGMAREEGRALLRELIEWATQPQYMFSVQWHPGDMVIWDNLCSMHRGGEFDYENERRDMRRTTVREAAPPDAPDDPFSELFVNTPKPVNHINA